MSQSAVPDISSDLTETSSQTIVNYNDAVTPTKETAMTYEPGTPAPHTGIVQDIHIGEPDARRSGHMDAVPRTPLRWFADAMLRSVTVRYG